MPFLWSVDLWLHFEEFWEVSVVKPWQKSRATCCRDALFFNPSFAAGSWLKLKKKRFKKQTSQQTFGPSSFVRALVVKNLQSQYST